MFTVYVRLTDGREFLHSADTLAEVQNIYDYYTTALVFHYSRAAK